MISRRQMLKAAGASFLLPGVALRAQELHLGAPISFSYDALRDRARSMATRPYAPPPRPAPDITMQIDYATHGQIRFRPDPALSAGGGKFPVSCFHLGQFFQKSVKIHALSGAKAREILYRGDYFDMPADSIARRLPQGAGFAGLRLQESPNGPLDWRKNDWVAFLGASYFRAIGELRQYGLSARALAVNAANPQPPHLEEFPDFREFWIDQDGEDPERAMLYALLDGPSVCGAYRFDLRRSKAVWMEVDAAIFLRQDIVRLGIAPLTSMYWFSETVKPTAIDWRPEVHDSDGLALWTGRGERLWRPLNNPPRTVVSSFNDEQPGGFGLLQRDRVFDHYQDGVRYDLRPSAWVEPIGNWGAGSVQLIEIPTDDEIHDNVTAMWVPAEPASRGRNLETRYRLHWLADEPHPGPLARCVGTRLGNGGVPGQPRPKGVRKFMVEFLGGPLAQLAYGVKPEAVLWASRGQFSYVFTEPVPNDTPGHWRAQFDLAVTGNEPVELRLYLRSGEQTLSETWAYQYHPFGNP